MYSSGGIAHLQRTQEYMARYIVLRKQTRGKSTRGVIAVDEEEA